MATRRTSTRPGGKATRTQMFTAGNVADFCEVDLKTIHNWANRGALPHFRTPGGHLRFRRLDVLAFLQGLGYPIPPRLLKDKVRVLLIRGEAPEFEGLGRLLSAHFDFLLFQDPIDALIAIGRLQPEVVIADLDMQGADGRTLLARLKAHPLLGQVRLVALASDPDARAAAAEAGVAGACFLRGEHQELLAALKKMMGVP